MCDKLQHFEKTQVGLEYKVSDIVKMLTLVQNFVTTYDQEAISNRETLARISTEASEAKLLGNCLEQKVHYIERELTKV